VLDAKGTSFISPHLNGTFSLSLQVRLSSFDLHFFIFISLIFLSLVRHPNQYVHFCIH